MPDAAPTVRVPPVNDEVGLLFDTRGTGLGVLGTERAGCKDTRALSVGVRVTVDFNVPAKLVMEGIPERVTHTDGDATPVTTSEGVADVDCVPGWEGVLEGVIASAVRVPAASVPEEVEVGDNVILPATLLDAVLQAVSLDTIDPLLCPLDPVTVGVDESVDNTDKVPPPTLVGKVVAVTVPLTVTLHTLPVDRLDREREGDPEEEGGELTLPQKVPPRDPVFTEVVVAVGVKLAQPVEDTVLVGAKAVRVSTDE